MIAAFWGWLRIIQTPLPWKGCLREVGFSFLASLVPAFFIGGAAVGAHRLLPGSIKSAFQEVILVPLPAAIVGTVWVLALVPLAHNRLEARRFQETD